jgi:hypothetical protein
MYVYILYIQKFVNMYIYMCVYVYFCIQIYIHIYVYVYVYVYEYMCVFISDIYCSVDNLVVRLFFLVIYFPEFKSSIDPFLLES